MFRTYMSSSSGGPRGRRTGGRRRPGLGFSRRPAAWIERLEERKLLASGDPIISEFLASNSSGLADQDGDHSDWIELYNPSSNAINLAGWSLTDDPETLDEWRFPNVTIDPSGFLVVFASGKNRAIAGAELHTNFKLGAGGDYLALVHPDAATVASEFAPKYPPQSTDVSYGAAFDSTELVAPGAPVEVKVPANGALEGSWTSPTYTPGSDWTRGRSGVGYGILQPGFSIHYVQANIGLGDLDSADRALSTPSLQVKSVVTSADTINYLGTGSGANFSGDQPFPTQTINVDVDNVAIQATGLVTIPSAGAWSFGVNSDDGFRLTLERNGQVLTTSYAGPRGAGDTISVFNVPEPGRWNIRLEYFEGGGGSEVELFAARGNHPAFDGGVFRLVGDASNGGLAVGSVLADDPGGTSLVGQFVADDLNGLADGAAVSSWTDRDPDGNGAVTASAGGSPRLGKNQLNGHSTVRFDPADGGDQVRIAAASNPLGEAGDFSAAVVFRTDTPGLGAAGDWWANAGLIDAEQLGANEDWGLSFDAAGQVAAGIGNPDVSVYSRAGLADGRAHLAVLVRSAGVLSIYVDGRLQERREDASSLPRNLADLVFGSLQTNSNYFTGEIAEVRLYSNDLTDSQVQRLATELDATYDLPGVTPSAVATDVRGDMQGVNATAYVRVPFNSPDPSGFDVLSLRMRYDDGFVAYLNGVEVARRNAPSNPAYNSTATAEKAGDPTAIETFNLTPYLGLLHAGSNLLAIRGLNVSAADDDFLVLPELTGSRVHTDQLRYFATPTPGSPNANPYLGLIAPVSASVSRRFFTAPFTVALGVPTSGAEIRYTLDGSEPSASHGAVYNGPLTVSGTTTLRAGAFGAGYLSSPTIAQTYLFLDDVIRQSPDGSPPPGWPSSWGNNSVDYGMDPDIVNDPTYGGAALQAALKAIPTISLSTDLANLFDPARGIYANAFQQGEDWERPASVELINPDGSPGFQIDAGLRIRGGYSRLGDNPKHAFRLFFRGEYGASSLDFPLFGAEGAGSFQKVDLRTAQNYSWSFGGDPNNNFVAEVFSRETMRDMGQPYTRSRFYQLYIDGQYWGLYQTEERPEANYAATYFGGNKDNYDVVKVEAGPYTVQATDGNLDAWSRLWQAATDPSVSLASDAAYFGLQGKKPDGSNDPNAEVLVDVDNLIDYMITIFYGGNLDAPISAFLGNNAPNNFYAIRDRTGGGGFKFIIHDAEHTLLDVNENRNGPYPAGQDFAQFNPQFLHQQLMANANYRLRFADRVQKTFFDGGALSPEVAAARFRGEAAQIRLAIIGESARWGDAKRPDSPLTQADWQAAVNRILDNYLPYRTAIVLDQFRAIGLFPAAAAPTFSLNGTPTHGGTAGVGDQVGLIAPAGPIYYTTDGSDPRRLDGSVSPSAIAYDPAVTTTTLIATGATWSYLDTGVAPAAGWTTASFDDGGWKSGPAELGYGDGDEATVVDFGPDPGNRHITTYFRRAFSVGDLSRATGLTLRLKRDDGAVVYINGVEVLRSNMPSGAIDGSTLASGTVSGDDEANFLTFALNPGFLVAGDNIIAVEIHQGSASSSDVSFDLGLALFASDATPIALDATTLLTARAYVNGAWSAIATARFEVNVPAAAGNLAITEFDYHPQAVNTAGGELDVDREQFEFLELRNVGTREINLAGVRFTKGITFDFTNAAITTLAPGAYVLIVKNPAAFASRYGAGLPIAGTYDGSLSNSGERLLLIDASGATIEDFAYGTKTPWPTSPDGGGPSLVRIDPLASPALPANWRPSGTRGGNPGGLDTNPPTITPIPPPTIVEDSDTGALAFTIGDVETPAANLIVTVSSDNPTLLAPGSLVLAGIGANRTLTITPSANASGSATITLVVTDGNGETSRTSFLLTVTPVNDLPIGTADSYAIDEDSILTATAASGVLANDADVEGDPISAVLDRTTAHGSLTLRADGSFVYIPEPNYHGTDSFTYHPNDGTADGPTVTVSLVVNSVPDSPTLAPIADGVVEELVALSFVATANDPDLPDDTLTFSLDPGAPAGAAIDPSTGAFTWTPSEAQGPGVYTITVRVSDAGSPSRSASRTFRVTVHEVNLPPVLPEFPDRVVDEMTTLRLDLGATDPDRPSQSLTYSLGDGAPSGAAIDRKTGAFTWTPTEAQGPATYSITVRVRDDGSPSRSASRTFRVTVHEINRPPVLFDLPDRTIDEQATLTLKVGAIDLDRPTQSLTYSLDDGAPAGASIDAVTGLLTWTPTEAQGPATYAITVRVLDNGSPMLSASRTFRVKVNEVNRPPALAEWPDRIADEGSLVTFTARATDPDRPSQTLTYSLAPGAPEGAMIDPRTGVFTWTPTEAQGPATYSITVRVRDDGSPSRSASRTFRVTVNEVNRPPVLPVLPDLTIDELATLDFSIAANDPDLPASSLVYALAPGAPAGAAIDRKTGRFTWTPDEARGPGVYAITVLVRDGGSPELTGSQTFSVRVTEIARPPVLSAIPDVEIRIGETLNLFASAVASGVPTPALIYALDPGSPADATIDPSTGEIRWTPAATQVPGRYLFVVRATADGHPDLSALQLFHANLTASPPPTVDLGSPTVVVAGGHLTRSGRFDSEGPGPWVATVDYGDGSGILPLIASADRAFTLDHAYASPGVYPVVVRVLDASGALGLSTLGVSVPIVGPTPLVTIAPGEVSGGKNDPMSLSLTFSDAVEYATATNLRNYRLVSAGRDGKFGTKDDRVIKLASVSYDDIHHTVTIGTRKRLPTGEAFRLMVSGGSLRDLAGRALDGDRDGLAGGDFAASLMKRRLRVIKPPPVKSSIHRTRA